MAPALKAGRRDRARRRLSAVRTAARHPRQHQSSICANPCRQFFKDFPIEHLMSYYPAVYEGPDTEYYIGAERKTGEPDLQRGGPLARRRAGHGGLRRQQRREPGAAGLADARQVHPARHLRRALRIPVGQPVSAGPELLSRAAGLPQSRFGRLFVRSSWDDSATGSAISTASMQLFEDGKVTARRAASRRAAALAGSRRSICFAKAAPQVPGQARTRRRRGTSWSGWGRGSLRGRDRRRGDVRGADRSGRHPGAGRAARAKTSGSGSGRSASYRRRVARRRRAQKAQRQRLAPTV